MASQTALPGVGLKPTLVPRQQAARLQLGDVPPPDFYAGHLRGLLTAVLKLFSASPPQAARSAEDPTLDWARRALQLPAPAQRLLARLLTRRGPVFRVDQLAYPEIPNLEAAISGLQQAGLAECCGIGLGTDLLARLRKAELVEWFADELSQQPASPKPVLVESLHRSLSDAMLRHRLAERLRWLQLLGIEHFRRLQLAYFGERHGTLTQFVVESVGVVRYPAYQLSVPDWLSAQASCLHAFERFHQCCDLTWNLSTAGPVHETGNALRSHWRIAQALLQTAPATSQVGRKHRALLRLGQSFERHQSWWPALCCYAASGLAPAGERRLRILWRLGQRATARTVAGDLARQAVELRDRAFATGVPRHGIRRPPARVVQHRVSLLEPPYARPIEQQALSLLQRPGDIGWHVENSLPLGVMGLVYWDVLYGPMPGAFSRPFQTAPTDLGSAGFCQRRAALIATAERAWLSTTVHASEAITVDQVSGGALAHRMEQNRVRQQGCQNPFVHWNLFTEERLQQLLARLPAILIARLAHFTLRNLASFRTGFPDLILLPPAGSAACIEVKGPNDALQPTQRQWLQILPTLGFTAWVLKIDGGQQH